MSAKEAVDEFLRLGAKFEVVLVGLHGDVERLRNEVAETRSNNADSAATLRSIESRLADITDDVENAITRARQRDDAARRVMWIAIAAVAAISLVGLFT